MADTSSSLQWYFPLSALDSTPSDTPRSRELYDRARGVEFLFRLGSSLALPTSAMCTAATWFHRFYMRHSMSDFHRQDLAAACIFLATKTEECGRKLRDVARVCQAKIHNTDVNNIPADGKEVEQCQTAILLTEEVLLEAICFDFVVENPHSHLVDMFDAVSTDDLVQEYAWSIAHDSLVYSWSYYDPSAHPECRYRTPLCILYPPKIVAAACYVLAQRIHDGPNSPSLDARIAVTAPCMSLPTPPTHKPPSPDATRSAIEHFQFTESEISSVAVVLAILIDFYCAQDTALYPYLSAMISVPPPVSSLSNTRIFAPFSTIAQISTSDAVVQESFDNRTPNSSHGGHTPMTHISDAQHIT
ncbi:cyclin-like protein [Macrolepiota fuliginosa MF-IS2]|uniref:Cyclin-like protein n=1 Tax=Macrolepiota fuliginosa MF-IS2 TaxID=1400762 RepID=A0A9P5XGN2_9AGAR|nr:cyclin-like protein [Macrolepiota fuliginosa MF-IS2]